MLSPVVLQQITSACSTIRIKSELKRGKPFCGRSVKEIIAAAGKRQLTSDKVEEKIEEDEFGSPLSSNSRRNQVRLSLNRGSIGGYLRSQENLLDFISRSNSSFVSEDDRLSPGYIPLNPGRRNRKGSPISPLAHSSVNLLSSINNTQSDDDSFGTPLKKNSSTSRFNLSNSPVKLSPQQKNGVFDITNSPLNFNNVAAKDDDGLLSLNATRDTELSATEVQFNLGNDLGKASDTECDKTFDFLNHSGESYEYYSEVSAEFQDENNAAQTLRGRKRRCKPNIFDTPEGRQLFQNRILERGVFSDDSDEEKEPKRKPILSRFMTEPDDYDEAREEKRIKHHEKFMADTLSRQSRFGKYMKMLRKGNNITFNGLFSSQSYTLQNGSPTKDGTVVDTASLYKNSPSGKTNYTNNYLDNDYDDTLKTSGSRRHHRHRHSGSSSKWPVKKNHKFLSGDF